MVGDGGYDAAGDRRGLCRGFGASARFFHDRCIGAVRRGRAAAVRPSIDSTESAKDALALNTAEAAGS